VDDFGFTGKALAAISRDDWNVRFSLRTLFVVMACVALYCAWLDFLGVVFVVMILAGFIARENGNDWPLSILVGLFFGFIAVLVIGLLVPPLT
jgi:hypothetical protein